MLEFDSGNFCRLQGFYADVVYDVQMLRILYTTGIIFMR